MMQYNDPRIRPLSFGGLNVVESPPRPRYVMPEWLVPGVVRWDPKFRAEVNEWARTVCGSTNVIPSGVAYVIGGHTMAMRPDAVAMIKNIC